MWSKLKEDARCIDPTDEEFFYNRGNVFRGLARFNDALISYDRALAIQPNYPDALCNRGSVLKDLKRPDDALVSYDRALSIRPDDDGALINRGNALQALKRFDDALASYDRALAINPNYAEAFYNRGNAFQELKRYKDALASYDRALTIRPDYAEALNNRGSAMHGLRRFDDALASYDRALAIKPDYAEAFYNRANALQELKRYEDALASYDRALAITPDYAAALHNRGNALRELKGFDDALASYDRALAIKSDDVGVLINRGNALQALNRFGEALASYDRALAIAPDHAFLCGLRLFCKLKLCDWHGLSEDFDQLAVKIESGEQAATPFAVLATPLSAKLQRLCAETFVREKHPETPLLPPFAVRQEHDRIRLGYFSSDFRNHPVGHLIAGLLECHDRAKFEVIGFSLSPPTQDAMRARLEKSFDRLIDVGALSDRDIALLARRLEIDIAIDLNGFTQDSRPSVFALRAAPLQVSYLGYPGTMGAPYIDYLIADATLIPQDQQRHYAEKIVYLPDTYQVNDSKRPIADKQFTRGECNLPEEGFVFCCFNNSYKIAPDIFDVWMRLLKRIGGSVLWLFEENADAIKNLRAEAQGRGIAPERLIFASRMPVSEHLARHRLADLFLDTLPYNAHTTTADALWAGVPVLTCLGKAFPGRVAASLLNAVGLPELITKNLDQYEEIALELATKPRKMLLLRKKLAANRLTHPLFDTARFANHIESAFSTIFHLRQRGLAPAPIHVRPDVSTSSATV